jgi:hypothetical protein
VRSRARDEEGVPPFAPFIEKSKGQIAPRARPVEKSQSPVRYVVSWVARGLSLPMTL